MLQLHLIYVKSPLRSPMSPLSKTAIENLLGKMHTGASIFRSICGCFLNFEISRYFEVLKFEDAFKFLEPGAPHKKKIPFLSFLEVCLKVPRI